MEEHYKKARKISLFMAVIIGGIVAYFAAFLFGKGSDGEILGINGMIASIRTGSFLFQPSVRSVLGIMLGIAVGLAIYFINYMDSRQREHYKNDEVAGTGRFMTDKEIESYLKKKIPDDPPVIDHPVPYDPEHDKEMYSQSIIMSARMRRHVEPRNTTGNNNIIMFGGPGSGKTRTNIKPNILQMNTSFVITDPSGEIVHSLGSVLRDHGYKIKIFNLSDMKHSNHYNPLKYVRDDAGVQSLITCFIDNTQKGEAGGDNQFFVDAEKLLYSACIYYLRDYCPDGSEKNFGGIVNLVNSSDIDENNPSAESKLDRIFKRLPENSLAWEMYTAFKQGAGKTLRSIIISCLVRLERFMVPDVEKLTGTDDIDLDRIAYEKTALFIITPQGDDTYSFLASMLYSQLFDTLYSIGEQRERETGNAELPIHVRCLMDEFVNIGEIPNFTQKLTTMRKYNISATIVVQSISQIEAKYKDDWRTLIDGCSTSIFLGGNEQNTVKYFSEMLGKKTIRTQSNNLSKGKGKDSEGYQNTGREVMTPDEIRRMPSDECIVYTIGEYAIRDKKYDYVKHPYYAQTADSDPKRAFDYTKIPAYDIERSSIEVLMRARAEAARYWDMKNNERSRSCDLQDMFIEVDGVLDDEMSFGEQEDKMAFEQWVNDGVMKAFQEPQGPVCVILMEGIPIKRLDEFAYDVSARSKRRTLVVFDDTSVEDDDILIPGIGIDGDNLGLQKLIDGDGVDKIRSQDDLTVMIVNKYQLDEIRERIGMRLKGTCDGNKEER